MDHSLGVALLYDATISLQTKIQIIQILGYSNEFADSRGMIKPFGFFPR